MTQQQQQQEQEQAQQKKHPGQIELNEQGLLQPKDPEGKYRLAEMVFRSGMLPKGYDNPLQVMTAMQFAQELGLNPIQGIRNITMIKGQPALWGELPLALAIRTGNLANIEEFLFDKDYNKISFENKNLHVEAFGAVSRITHKLIGTYESSFTIEDAQKAGLLNRDSVWKYYPKIMLQRRARAFAIKALFPEALAGVSIAEYDFNIIPDQNTTDKTHNKSPSDILNDL